MMTPRLPKNEHRRNARPNPADKSSCSSVSGVVLLDKPAGLSSNAALTRVKRFLKAKKAGHTGTLDPFATGLLPLCFGEATKFSHDLLNADKTYEAVIHLGIRTATGDTEGEIVEKQDIASVLPERVESVLRCFLGDIAQIPPMYSALKRDGKPLYAYAREGVTLARDARRVRIHALELLDMQLPFLTLRVHCGKGTYIRVLGEDIGTALGSCAHLNALRRVRVGTLDVSDACVLEHLESGVQSRAQILNPVDSLLLAHMPVTLSEELANRFLQGQRLSISKEGIAVSANASRVRVYNTADVLLGTALIRQDGVLTPERLISLSALCVGASAA
ncbi:MAG: tRNA pseudouridine(55) synthase TruB [Burkholderiaceae bacterium]|jgi:tRNA pseudouridine55 synthase|nr:tRNA pseudouridine(55) synthase TruB [Burkholderiaceae bacterium]